MVATVATVGAMAAVTIATGGVGGAIVGPAVSAIGNVVATSLIPSAVTTAVAAGGGAAAVGVGTAAAAGAATAGAASVAAAAGVGVSAAAGTSSALATVGAVVAATGPIGWIVAGASESHFTNKSIVAYFDDEGDEIIMKPQYSFDCWKQLVHESSPQPSKGRTLNDLLEDPRIKNFNILWRSTVPQLLIKNKWNEKFILNFVTLFNGDLALHVEGKL